MRQVYSSILSAEVSFVVLPSTLPLFGAWQDNLPGTTYDDAPTMHQLLIRQTGKNEGHIMDGSCATHYIQLRA